MRRVDVQRMRRYRVRCPGWQELDRERLTQWGDLYLQHVIDRVRRARPEVTELAVREVDFGTTRLEWR